MATNEAPTVAALDFIKSRYMLHCSIKSGPDGKPIAVRLYTEPDLSTLVTETLTNGFVEIWVDTLVDAPPLQFLGGRAATSSRCPAVERVVPSGDGDKNVVNHWYMLSSDLDCRLIPPGDE